MIAEYLKRRDAENYARELARHYGPDVHFDVVGMPDPVFGDAVWYVLGTGTVDGRAFAQYAHCLFTTSDAADDPLCVDPGGRRIIKKKKILRIREQTKHLDKHRHSHFCDTQSNRLQAV